MFRDTETDTQTSYDNLKQKWLFEMAMQKQGKEKRKMTDKIQERKRNKERIIKRKSVKVEQKKRNNREQKGQ